MVFLATWKVLKCIILRGSYRSGICITIKIYVTTGQSRRVRFGLYAKFGWWNPFPSYKIQLVNNRLTVLHCAPCLSVNMCIQTQALQQHTHVNGKKAAGMFNLKVRVCKWTTENRAARSRFQAMKEEQSFLSQTDLLAASVTFCL